MERSDRGSTRRGASGLERRRALLHHRQHALADVLAADQRGQRLVDPRQRRIVPLVAPLERRLQRGAHRQRRGPGDPLGVFEGPCQFLAGFHHLGEQAHAQGFVGIELIAGEDVAHGVGPARRAREAHGGSAQRRDAA